MRVTQDTAVAKKQQLDLSSSIYHEDARQPGRLAPAEVTMLTNLIANRLPDIQDYRDWADQINADYDELTEEAAELHFQGLMTPEISAQYLAMGEMLEAELEYLEGFLPGN